MADPLTTGDQFDTARALTQATGAARGCKSRMDALVDAVDVRESVMKSVKDQLEK